MGRGQSHLEVEAVRIGEITEIVVGDGFTPGFGPD
jgi:hypothetical protein